MTFSQFVDSALITIAGVLSVGIVSPANALGAPHIRVELVVPVEAQTAIIRGTAVRCQGTSCIASRSNSSAKNMCVKIAREFGEIAAFRMGKREFDDAALAKCNSDKRAKLKISKSPEMAAR